MMDGVDVSVSKDTLSKSSAATKKVALVTGSAKRLGKALALRLAGAGYFTWVHYLSSKSEAEAVLALIHSKGGRGALVQADVAVADEVRALVEKIRMQSGRLDVLVNNVGIYRTGSLLEYSIEDFAATLQTNLVAAFHLSQSCLPLFPKAGGSIVNIGYAGIESQVASVHNTAYLISKNGLLVLTKSLAQALGPRAIRVNMVSPGILDNSVELPQHPKDHIPLERLGKCEDICDAVDFLVGERAGYVTGVNLDVAGGYMLKLNGLEPAT